MSGSPCERERVGEVQQVQLGDPYARLSSVDSEEELKVRGKLGKFDQRHAVRCVLRCR